jgi:ABC-type uncharacterized transport system substrate-binding protein
MTKHLRTALLALAGSLIIGGPALAHPHVWVTMTTELVYAPDGSVKAVRHAWSFDDMFSVFATQGIDGKTKGQYTRDDLRPLAQTNVESLKEFDYFTAATVNGKKAEFDPPTSDYYAEYKDAVLTLHFTLPFKEPVKAKDVDIEVFDPSYFVDFSFADKDPASLVGANAACKLAVKKPGEMDPDIAQRLSQLGPDAKVDPSMMLGSQYAYKITVKCP